MNKAVKKLNFEIECERKGRKILNTVMLLFGTITIVGPLILLILLNADWVDHFFLNPWVQLGFLILISFMGGLLWLKSKLR